MGLGLAGEAARDVADKIVTLLGLENEIDVQNGLFELEEFVPSDMLSQLYESRHELYFGSVFEELQDNPSELQKELDRARQVEQPSKTLKALLSRYGGSVDGVSGLARFGAGNARSSLEAVSLAELVRLPKKYVSLRPLQENLISFNAAPLKLPKDSVRVPDKGFEEIRIPHQLSVPDPNEQLVRISQVPEHFREAFGDLKTFNRVQSKVFDYAFRSKQNMLVCAPTGAGKTIVSLLAILGLIDSYMDQDTQLINLSNFKVVYLAPMKALVAEVVATLNYRLNYLGIKAAEFTGDIHLSRQEFEDASIIVSTPEKWDVLSRKTVERQFSEKLRLLIVDEIHLLGDSRGPVLEAVISRALTQEGVRVVGLSATLPNYTDVAAFMGIAGKEGLFYFNNSYRPVPLAQVYVGVSEGSGIKKATIVRDVLFRKVIERVKDHQMLVFVHSRKETVKTANEIKETAFAENVEEVFVTPNSKAVIEGLKSQVINSDLQALLASGIGFHHAGLPRSDRKLVEDLFAGGHLSVLVSTATLAWGVNLPAHTVIIKGTQVYSAEAGKWVPLSGQNLLQMLGRAGRPGFDRDGEGIIITSSQEIRHYIAFLNEQEPIESGLLSALPEALNAEVVLGQIQNLKDAAVWLTRSFLFQRLRQNPRHYGLTDKIDRSETALASFVVDAVHSAASELDSIGLARYNRDTGVLESTPEGRIASFFYLKPENMRVFKTGLEQELNEIDLFKLFSSAVEFKNIAIREEEKVELAKLYTSVPIPVKGPVDDPKSKVSVLLQCHISRVELEGYALNCDLKFVSENAQRIFRALLELCLHRRSANCQLVLDYCKVTERRAWKELSPLRQFQGVSPKTIQRIEQQEHLSFAHFKTMTVAQLNNVVRNEQAADRVHQLLKRLPHLDTDIYIQVLSRSLIKVSINWTANFVWDSALHGGRLLFRVLVLDVDQERLLHHQPFFVYRHDCTTFKEEKTVEFPLRISEPLPSHLFLRVVSDEWLASDTGVPVFLKKVVLPTKAPPCLETPAPLEERPEALTQVIDEWGRILGVSALTDFQVALFGPFYDTFEHILLAAPRGSGRFTLALIAMIRLYQQSKSAKSVVLFPKTWQVDANWDKLAAVAKKLGVTIQRLTGILQTDIQSLSAANILVATVKDFERLTRNYKKRPQLKEVRLVLAADLFAFEDSDAAYELVMTRLRIIFSHTKQLHRILVTATPVADSHSVCDWLQIKPDFCFAFHPSCRNNEMSVLINSIEAIQSANFVEICAKKCMGYWQAMEAGCVFVVNTVVEARLFVSLLSKEMARTRSRFAMTASQSALLAQARESFEDMFNCACMEFGAAYLYPVTPIEELDAIERLFSIGALRVVVMPRSLLGRFRPKSVAGVGLIDAGVLSHAEMGLVSGLLNQLGPDNFEGGVTAADRPKRNLLVFIREWEKEAFKDKLLEPAVLESTLGHNFIEALNIQVASEAVQSKEGCISWLTWTFFYRRLTANPNFYNLSSADPQEINDYISALVDEGANDLMKSGCIEVDDQTLSPDNNGVVANFYDLKIPTVSAIAGSFGETFGWRVLLQVLASSAAQGDNRLTPGEFALFEELNERIPLKVPKSGVFASFFKQFVLLQAYCIRADLPADYEVELKATILPEALTVLNGVVALASPQGLLVPALLAIKMSKMLVQRLWHTDNTLKQLPFFSDETIKKAASLGVQNLDDFLSMDDDPRDQLLAAFSAWEKEEIARFANAFPNVQIEARLGADDGVFQEETEVAIEVTIAQDLPEDADANGSREVLALGFVRHRDPSWWLLIGDRDKSQLFFAKRIQFGAEYSKTVTFAAPAVGHYNLSVLLLSDSYMGFDVEADKLRMVVQTAES
jgi:pre-mRNA-splicing helicase BRR2